MDGKIFILFPDLGNKLSSSICLVSLKNFWAGLGLSLSHSLTYSLTHYSLSHSMALVWHSQTASNLQLWCALPRQQWL